MKTEKNTGMIAFRFRQVLLYIHIYILYIYIYILLNVDTFYRTYVTVHRRTGCTELSGSIEEEEFLK